jgi:hypothetical protein
MRRIIPLSCAFLAMQHALTEAIHHIKPVFQHENPSIGLTPVVSLPAIGNTRLKLMSLYCHALTM